MPTIKSVKGFIEVLGYALVKREGFYQIVTAEHDKEIGGRCIGLASVLDTAKTYLGGCANWEEALRSELGWTETELEGFIMASGIF